MSDRSLEKLLSALADAHRLNIVLLLARKGPQNPTALRERLAPLLPLLSQPSVSRHLKVLRDAGIVEQGMDPDSRNKCGRLYWLAPGALSLASAMQGLAAEIKEGVMADLVYCRRPMSAPDLEERHRQQTAATELEAGATRGTSPQEPPP